MNVQVTKDFVDKSRAYKAEDVKVTNALAEKKRIEDDFNTQIANKEAELQTASEALERIQGELITLRENRLDMIKTHNQSVYDATVRRDEELARMRDAIPE